MTIFKHKILSFLIAIPWLLVSVEGVGQNNISGTINNYTEVTNINVSSCSTLVDVSSPGAFSAGDRVVIMQMKGASINTTNTSSYGAVSNYQNAGNYEFADVTNVNGNTVVLRAPLSRNYTPMNLVQLIRVPTYNNATVTTNLSAPGWDGTTGGVLALEVSGDLTLNADINMNGKGFRGGANNLGTTNCGASDYAYTMASGNGGRKGEGITAYTASDEGGRGPLANGGGGGNNNNAGGAGGGNGGRGGSGGDQWTMCPGPNYALGGDGGRDLIYSNAQNKVFQGGGGGAGHADDNTNQAISGTAGGGIIIIRANTVTGNNNAIRANGADNTNTATDDGSGGGGAGGAILLDVAGFNGQLTVAAEGGNGADNDLNDPNGCLGPGGGGAGGVVWTSAGSLPASVTTSLTAGQNGVATNPSNSCSGPYGATDGDDGIILNNLSLPENTYEPPTASVPFADTSICSGQSIQLAASGGNSFQWMPDSSLSNSSTANPVATPDTSTTYKVIVSDGTCDDTASIAVELYPLPPADAGPDQAICNTQSTQLQASGGTSYEWIPSIGLDNKNIANPRASPSSTKTYQVTVTDTNGCQQSDNMTLTVHSLPPTEAGPDQEICRNDTAQLMADDNGNSYVWNPQKTISDANAVRPFASPSSTTTYQLVETNQFGCVDSDRVSVTIRPLPTADIRDDTTIYLGGRVNLGVNADSIIWNPENGLANPASTKTPASPQTTTTYNATIFNQYGCTAQGSVKITVERCDDLVVPTAFSPNGDGYNDSFGYLNGEELDQLETFQVFDRWGNLVFQTDEKNVRWEGRHMEFNAPAEGGVYMYVIKGRCNNKQVVKQGNVTLVR